MPELPEVEIVKRSLKNKVNFKKIKKIIVTNRNLRFKIQKNFKKVLEGRLIINISRFSKYIILTLDKQNYCLIHLGMSGTFKFSAFATLYCIFEYLLNFFLHLLIILTFGSIHNILEF